MHQNYTNKTVFCGIAVDFCSIPNLSHYVSLLPQPLLKTPLIA